MKTINTVFALSCSLILLVSGQAMGKKPAPYLEVLEGNRPKQGQGQPDLIPHNFKNKLERPRRGKCEILITSKVRNMGNAGAGKYTLEFKVDDKVVDTDEKASLRARTTSPKYRKNTEVPLGAHDISVHVDTGNVVNESNELNNSSTQTVNC